MTAAISSISFLRPTPGVDAGSASGGGFLDRFIGGATGMTATPQQATLDAPAQSVGLFDGVLKKAFMSGATSAAATAIFSFIPGTPIVAGIVGALAGGAMAVAGNWMKKKQIEQQNQALIASLGVQPQTPEMAEALKSGDMNRIVAQMQLEQSAAYGTGQQQYVNQQDPVQQTTQQAPVQQTTQQTPVQQTSYAPGEDMPPNPYTGLAVNPVNPAVGTVPGGGGVAGGGVTPPPPLVDPATVTAGSSPVPIQGNVAVVEDPYSGQVPPGSDAVPSSSTSTSTPQTTSVDATILGLNEYIARLEARIAALESARAGVATLDATAADEDEMSVPPTVTSTPG